MSEKRPFSEERVLYNGREHISMRKIFAKMIVISALPLLVMGLAISGISIFSYTDVIEEEIREELRTTAYGVSDNYNYLDSGDYSQREDGKILKGDTVISGKLTQMQVEIIRNGLVCTFFYGDTRIDTSVVDVSGNNMSGTKMSEEI